jgi:hypothetical protein
LYVPQNQIGWVFLFPDAAKPGALEQFNEPFTTSEAKDPAYRSVEVYITF